MEQHPKCVTWPKLAVGVALKAKQPLGSRTFQFWIGVVTVKSTTTSQMRHLEPNQPKMFRSLACFPCVQGP